MVGRSPTKPSSKECGPRSFSLLGGATKKWGKEKKEKSNRPRKHRENKAVAKIPQKKVTQETGSRKKKEVRYQRRGWGRRKQGPKKKKEGRCLGKSGYPIAALW